MEIFEYIKGPSFYKEEDQNIFWGRDEEIRELYYLVSNSDFSICYAKSGEGKSSLLNAGVIPLLRERNFLPVCVRFTPDNYKENNPDFDSWIGNLIENARRAISANCYKSVDFNGKESISDTNELLHHTLWWKLRVNEIRKDAFVQLTPVLIFDQFEEIFTCSENVEWVNRFFAWLESLYNDMNPLDDANIGRLPKKFKVLLSLRSEYVCELDYWSMQRYFIPSLKNNRYYLKPLTGKSAEKIINEILSKTKIDNISKEEVFNFSQNDDIMKSYVDRPCKSALKLSLILDTCYRYSEKIKNLVEKNGNALSLADILEIYYEESTADLSREQRNKLEDLLVDSNGRRTKVSRHEISEKTRISETQLERLKENRIITTANANDIEIAHDCMCEIVSKHSVERRKILEQEQIQAVKNKWFVIAFVFLSICGIALFYSFRTWFYPEIKGHYLSKGISQIVLHALKNDLGTIFLCLSPYFFPLAVICIYCRMKRGVKEYVKLTDILSVVSGTLFVIATCFLRDSIFCDIIGTPNMRDSIWYVMVPLLLYLSCIFYLWDNLKMKRKTICCFLGIIFLFPIIELLNVFFDILVFGGLLLVSIGLLVVTFKKLSVKACVFIVALNTLVLVASVIAHLGFIPWKVINYSEVKAYSTPWRYIIIEKEHRYGALDATTGDTIVPCMFDGITCDGFVMMLPKYEGLSDSLLGLVDADSIKKQLIDRGEYAQLNNKDGIRYIWLADKRLYDLSKEDTIYKGKAAKAYFVVRDDLYKAIRQNTSINKIDTKILMALYRMECDSIDALRYKLKYGSDVKNTELLITHTARKMAIATMMDMINDNRPKYSLLIAFTMYKLSYFSKEFHDVHMNFHASIKNKYNYISWNAEFSNNDFSMLGTLSLWQYVYVNTLTLATPLYKKYLVENLQSKTDEMTQSQLCLLEKLSRPISFDNKDVDKIITDIRTGEKLAESIGDIVSLKSFEQIPLVDSLASINDKYKSCSPFPFIYNNSLKNIKNTAYENIRIFYMLYDCCSKRNDYHYAIFRQKMIDNLQLACFCGSDIISDVNCLELKDSTYFNHTYEYLRNMTKKVNRIRENAKKIEDKLKETKEKLQRKSNYHK